MAILQKDIDQKKQTIGSLFDRIAPKYDKLNHLLSFDIDKIWRKKAAKQIDNNTDNILDIATGTCDLAIEILKQKKTSSITAIDLSEKMLSIGQTKINKLGLNNNICLKQISCENLPFQDNSFSAVVCGFGVRNFAKLDICLSQMYRVLKPNGKLVILEFSKPKTFPIKQIYNFYFSTILPFVGKILSDKKGAYNYLYQSVKHFPDSENFATILSAVGFKDCSFKSLSFGICTLYLATK